MQRTQRLGWMLAAVGLVAALAFQLGGRTPAPPLYDGVIVAGPYLWLDPPPDHPGGATGASASIAVTAGANQLVAVATGEDSPQAQVIGEAGSLTLAPGASSVKVTITPVEPPAPILDGYLDGNVYRFDVVDQAGRPATALASAYVSIVLRAADPADIDATIERFDGTRWVPTNSSSGGADGYLAIVTQFGDFAVVGHGTSPYPTLAPGAPSATPGASTEGTASPVGSPAATALATPAPSAAPAEPDGSSNTPIAIAVIVIAVGLGALLAARVVRDQRIRDRQRVRPGWRNRR